MIRFGEVQRYRMSGDRSSLPAPSVRSRVLIQDPPPTCPDEQAGHVRVRVDQQRSRGSGYASQPMAVGSTAGRLAVLTRSLPGAGGDTMLETQGDWTGHPLFGSAGRCPRREETARSEPGTSAAAVDPGQMIAERDVHGGEDGDHERDLEECWRADERAPAADACGARKASGSAAQP